MTLNLHCKLLTGQQYAIDIWPTDSIGTLKAKIQEKCGVPIDLQKLVHGGTYLDDDDQALNHYNISTETTIHVFVRLRGGGGDFEFHNLDCSKLQERKHVSNAPLWRTIKQNGLCLEGLCTNAKCFAHQQLVVASHGLGSFNIPETPSVCPLCQTEFKAVTMGFTGCKWTWTGRQTNGYEVSGQMKMCGSDVYMRFDTNVDLQTNMTMWERLVIHAFMD